MQKLEVIFERFPYRYVKSGILEINGMPDYRIQKADSYTKRYRDMYLLDNQMQLLTAIEDGSLLHQRRHGWSITALVGIPLRVSCFSKEQVASLKYPRTVA
jgi:hypothetical protein